MACDEELAASGWDKRFVACEPRLSEAVELYKEIGFQVHLEPLPDKEALDLPHCEEDGCTACFEVDRERYRIIYTKPKDSGKD